MMSTLTKKPNDSISFLNKHFEEQPQLLTINATGGNPKVIDTNKIMVTNEHNNIYFCVNKVKNGVSKKAKKEDIESALFAHLDLDPVVDGKYSPKLREKLLELAKTVDCTFSIDSGNGVQLFWRLDKDDYSFEDIEDVNKVLIDKYKEYGADKGTHNIDRIMRLPFTKNYPTKTKIAKGYSEEPVASSLLQSTDKKYTLDELITGKVNIDNIEIIDSDDMSSIDFAFFKDYIALKRENNPTATPSITEMRKALKDKGLYEKRRELSNSPDKYKRDDYIKGTVKRAVTSLNALTDDFDVIDDTKLKTFEDIDFSLSFKEPAEPQPIEDTPFFKGVLQLVYAQSKLGKTRSIAETLLRAGFKGDDVIWLDRDYNIDSELGEVLKHFVWVNNNVSKIEKQLLNVNGEGRILVMDSLKDFAKGNSLDDNTGAQEAMEYLRQFITAGFTVIVIAHATIQKINIKDGMLKEIPKIKGNEEVIKSKCDLIFQLVKVENYREFRLTDSRISNVFDVNFPVLNKTAMEDKIKSVYSELEFETNGPITQRHIQRKLPSSMRKYLPEFENKLYKITKVGKAKIFELLETA